MAESLAEYKVQIGVDVVNNATPQNVPLPNTAATSKAYKNMISKILGEASKLTTLFVFGRSFFNRISRGFSWIANLFKTLVLNPIIKMGRAIWDGLANLPSTIFGYERGFGGLVKGATNFADELYRASMSFRQIFTTRGQSASEGQKFYEEVVSFAKRTPFETDQVVQSGQTMLAAGWDPKKLIGDFETIGDKMAQLGDTTGEKAQSVANNLVKMKFRGFAQAREVNYMATQGVAAWRFITKAIVDQGLAGKYGLKGPADAKQWTLKDYEDNVGVVRKLSEKRLISAEFGIQAILAGMKEESAGFMKKAAQATLSGVNIILRDALEVGFMAEMGSGILEGDTKSNISAHDWTPEEGSKSGWNPFGGLRQMMVDINNSLEDFNAQTNVKGKNIISTWGKQWAEFGSVMGRSIYGSFKGIWDKVTDVWSSDEFKKAPFFKQIMMTLSSVEAGLNELLNSITTWYNGEGKSKIKTIASQVGAFLGTLIRTILSPLTGKGKGGGHFGIIGEIATDAGASFIDSFWDASGGSLISISNDLVGAFKDVGLAIAGGLWDGFKAVLKENPTLAIFFGLWGASIVGGAVGNIGMLLSGLGSGLNKIGALTTVPSMNVGVIHAGSVVSGTGGGVPSNTMASVGAAVLPWLATAAVVTAIAAAAYGVVKLTYSGIWNEKGDSGIPGYVPPSDYEKVGNASAASKLIRAAMGGDTGPLSRAMSDPTARQRIVDSISSLAPVEQTYMGQAWGGSAYGDMVMKAVNAPAVNANTTVVINNNGGTSASEVSDKTGKAVSKSLFNVMIGLYPSGIIK